MSILTLALVLWADVRYAYTLPEEEDDNDDNPKGAVVSNGIGCAEAGTEIMSRGGTAIDVAIATLFCEGVTNPRVGRRLQHANLQEASGKSGLAVAVPGELIGYYNAYKKYGGGVPWADLPTKAIEQCEEGIYVSGFEAKMMESSKDFIFADPGLRETFINPVTNDTHKEGDYYKRPKLAETLRIIAKEGGRALHNGSLTESFVEDIRKKGGIITVADMENYRPMWRKPVQGRFDEIKLYSLPPPSSGALVVFMLNVMEGFLNLSDPHSLTNYQRMAETFKFAYGFRTKMGDAGFTDMEQFQILAKATSKRYASLIRKKINAGKTSQDPHYYGADTKNVEDHGTANICVLAPNGDAVVVTSSINYIYGAKFISQSTGIILNDSMDDFSTPGGTNVYGFPDSPGNYIAPGKRLVSSMSASIILDSNKDVSMVVGGAGGSRIPTSVVQVILNHLGYGMDLEKASNKERIHHQLFPMTLQLEHDFLLKQVNILNALKKIGHNLTITVPDGFVAVTCISKDKNSIVGTSDKRRNGSVDYVY
ncbi:hypothetical protein JTB14_032202 [Gonioctena quinquepunctata]|nr:hypothetical protein JTB14_032202 [Gonioctena quinquepunctata]